MLKKIYNFYRLTKNKSNDAVINKQAPVTFVHIFHKEYPRFESIKLDLQNSGKKLESLLQDRRSIRKFSDKPLVLKQISYVLNSCRILERGDEFERRTYPSAGARFPIELYVVSFNVKDLELGAYHYNTLKNSLELLLNNDLNKQTNEIVTPFISNPSAAIVMTSVIPRSEVKYSCKSYPFSLIEAGHMGQNISLCCSEHKIGCCAVGGFVDDTITKILDLTKDEMPIYAVALGNIP